MMINIFMLCGMLCVAFWVSMAVAEGARDKGATPPYGLTVETDKPEAVYRVGETALFRISLVNAAGHAVTGLPIQVTVAKEVERTVQTIVPTGMPLEVGVVMDRPGFAWCTAAYSYETDKTVNARCGAGFSPLEIKPSQSEPDDFESFWAGQKAELAKVPMKPVLTPLDPLPELAGKVEAFNVSLACPGGAPVSGYLARPVGAAAKSLPAFIYYHGAGVRSAIRQDKRALSGMLAMDINAHGIENGKSDEFYKELQEGRLKDYSGIGVDSRDDVYFRGMFLRALRALEFLKSQPEWDGKRLVVFGSSQGGAQAIMAAGLDSQVSYCSAMVPSMCDHTGVLAGRCSGGPKWIKLSDGRPVNLAIVKMAPYYDMVNFARRIKAKTFFNVGFVDVTTPPSSIYAAYNVIKAPKRITNWPHMGHEYNDKEAERLVLSYFGLK